jgi:hypothetical protein
MTFILCPMGTDEFGLGSECACCGGSATLGGRQEAIPGSAPILRYCSVECHDEWEDHLAQRGAPDGKTCESCGYDRNEHEEGCERP